MSMTRSVARVRASHQLVLAPSHPHDVVDRFNYKSRELCCDDKTQIDMGHGNFNPVGFIGRPMLDPHP
jgi:hypothetical protein